MGLLNLVRRGVGLAGKLLGDVANHVTGGLAGKVGNTIAENSGLIGKIAGTVGRAVVPSKVRNALSTVADAALEIIPEGKVKTALKKMNDAAQSRSQPDISTAKSNQYKSSNSTIASGEGTIYGSATAPRNIRPTGVGTAKVRWRTDALSNKRRRKSRRNRYAAADKVGKRG